MIVLLDYDGTLVPIVEDPRKAFISPQKKEFLKELSRKHTVAIVTGRDMRSFSEVFGDIPESLYVITSHGAKLYKGSELIKTFFPYKVPNLKPLREKVKTLPGVVLEEKEGCFALHFRNFDGNEETVRKVFEDFIKKHPPVKVIEGKKVLEGVYGEFDKGKGIEEFLKFLGWDKKQRVVYIGDDTTDLDAMRKVKALGGETVFVGKNKPPEADKALGSVEEVYEFLSRL